jgi:MOSC domain-containing protein YiiM
VDGDGQADQVNHGGLDKAICTYAADHYDAWSRELGPFGVSLQFGAFGENFSVDGLTEDDVCVGDIWRIGAVEVQVSQPRQPCWKLARRWRIDDMALRVVESGRTGWYLRVLAEGPVTAGLAVERVARPFRMWTITQVNRLLHHEKNDLAAIRELVTVPALSAAIRDTLIHRIERAAASEPSKPVV